VRRLALPLLAGILGLAGSLVITGELYRRASLATETLLEERLRGVGDSAALLWGDRLPEAAPLRALMETNNLDGAYWVSPQLAVLADAGGEPRPRVDLLRVDLSRLKRALAGEGSVGHGFSLGELNVVSAYFPVREGAAIRGALVLEAGKAFSRARQELRRALWGGVGLSFLSALALAVVAAGWSRSERRQAEAMSRAARADALTKMAAMAAHEIRNPLSVIRATVELMRERLQGKLGPREAEDLGSVLGEVERLRALTEDLMDLSADRPLNLVPVDLAMVAREAAYAQGARFSAVSFQLEAPQPVYVQADPGRLRQVFSNLLMNAAQAQGSGNIRLEVAPAVGEPKTWAVAVVQDEGPGVAEEVRANLFDPFVTNKRGGTGLGLALSKRLVERHGGTLRLVPSPVRGARFEIRIPLDNTSAREGAA
jgi:two-component system, OmpR family, sensor kinase